MDYDLFAYTVIAVDTDSEQEGAETEHHLLDPQDELTIIPIPQEESEEAPEE